MITEEEFVEKVNKQSGWIDTLDAFCLIHFFTERFGVVYTELSIEDELMYMWERLKLELQPKKHQICKVCKIKKDIEEYYIKRTSKYGRELTCRECKRKYMRKWMNEYNNKKRTTTT